MSEIIKQPFNYLESTDELEMIEAIYLKLLAYFTLGGALFFALLFHFLDLEDVDE